MVAVWEGLFCCEVAGIIFTHFIATMMALMQNIWKLKGSLRSASAVNEEFFGGGEIKCLFFTGISSPLVTERAESDSVTAAVGYPPSHRSIGYSSFSRFYLSSRTPTAGQRPSSLFSNHFPAFLSTETISRMYATPTVQCRSLWGCRCSSADLALEFRVSNLEKLLLAGLHLVTGQNLGGFGSPKVKANGLKQVTDVEISGLHQVSIDRRLSYKQTQMDADGFVDVEACECNARVVTTRRSWTRAIKGIDRSCEADVDSEVMEFPFGGIVYVQDMIPEKVSIQRSCHVKSFSSLSIGHCAFYHASVIYVLEDSYGSYAGKESSHLEFSGHDELQYRKDRLTNIDNDGVQHKNLRLLSGACCLPHPNKVKTGGEDAYFISSEEQVVGIADGVGGWADVGVDAGDYARELMLQSKLAVAQEPHGYIDPARVLIRAHARTKCRGSSTACILALSDYGLQAANLGDSAFVMMRNGRIIFKSPVQQHQFNIPFQLENGGSDPPSSAEVFSLQVVAGDVLVAGTDGLFDNLYDNELMGIVIHSTRAGLGPQLTAHNIATLARDRAEDRNRQTPFSTAAQEAGFRFYGGKMDDITVIVSYVTTIKPGFSKL